MILEGSYKINYIATGFGAATTAIFRESSLCVLKHRTPKALCLIEHTQSDQFALLYQRSTR